MFNKKKYLIFLLFPLIILGCGNESDNSDPSPKEKITINAQDLLTFSPTKNTQIIDLRNKITAEDNQSLVIENIENIDNNCTFNENDINGLTFKVTTTGANVCRFKYHVKTLSSKYKSTGEAIAQVVVTDDYIKGDFLPPVSRTITESGSITLDNKDLLIEEGFEIDPSSIYLTGESSSSDIGSIISADASSISYQAPSDTTGTVRIFYTEIDLTNNIARPGVIYIAIGQKGNHSPIATDNVLESITRHDRNIPFDISSFISDYDGDELQLIDVKSMLGKVEINSSNTFLYTPGSSGEDVITYIISDHNGGYGIGTLTLNIQEYLPIFDSIQELTFSPPLTINQLSSTEGIYSDTFKETGSTGYIGTYPTFNKELAEAYCKTKGMQLATLASLKAMRKNVLTDDKGNYIPIFDSIYHWHSGIAYLSKDSSALDLADGHTKLLSNGYFSCSHSNKELEWKFLTPYIGGLFNTPAKIYITSDNTEESIFLPTDEYNLKYEVEALSINGELVDPNSFSTYLSISISGNTVTVTKKSNKDAIAVTIKLSDPIVKDSITRLIVGVSLCPLTVSPPDADELGCILALHNKNEGFTAALSHNMLTILGMKEEQIKSLGDREIGSSAVKFRAIRWGNKETTDEERQQWLEKLQPACDALSKLKIDGRSNWVVGADNIEPNPFGGAIYVFNLSFEEYKPANRYVDWMWRTDDTHKYIGLYGLGYANADPTATTYINQNTASSEFDRQATYQPETNTYPSCWSKN